MSIKRSYYVVCGLFLALFLAAAVNSSSPPVVSSEPLLNARSDSALTTTPSPGPSCVSVTGSTPRCVWPNTISYYFGLYNSCNVTLSGSGAVQLELAPTSSGPWTVYNQQTVNLSLPPGSSYTAGNFIENNIPPEYNTYRFTLVLNTSNGQMINSTTVAASLCNTPNTPIPTPTGITTRCFMAAAGAQATCSQPDTYTYNFGIYSHCDTTMYGTVQVQLLVSPNQSGPWTTYDTRTSSRSYSPGVNSVQGTFTEPNIPSQYTWYRITMSASYPGPFGNRYVTSETQPAPICTGTSTATLTPTLSPTRTASPTPTSCPNNYNFTVSTGTIVSGTTLLAGSQCSGCIVNVALPFPFTFYGQTFSSANLSTQGNLQFTTTHLGSNTCPLPEPLLGPAMMPHWDETLDMSFHTPCQSAMGSDCGIYTSVSGSAPNRIYNIQWRARFISTSQHTANFEIRLYENSTYFEYIYGWVSYTGGNASIGVQDGVCRFTAYSCNTWNNLEPGRRIGWGGLPGSTPTPSPTATTTSCPQNYVYATATATIVPGTTDIGNHCDDCSTQITLPFPYQLYDQNFTSVHLESNGSAGFSGSLPIFPVSCFPVPAVTYIIFPYRDDLRTDCAGCGIFTSTSGTAPNRIFNIEWRTTYFSGGGTANFEIRLYEGQTRFDVIYGVLSQGNTGSLAGVQKNSTYWTQYFCNGQGGDANNGRLVVYTLPTCATSTAIPPTYTSTATSETTHTATVTGSPTSTPCNLSFIDVPPDNTFYTQVQCLACRAIVSGYSDGTFRTNNQVTRGQLAKIVSNAAGFSEPVSGQTFQDVPPTHTFYEFIERLTVRGYMTGYMCGEPGEPCVNNRPYFRPQNNATRGQTSKIVANAARIEMPIPPDQQTFEDVPPTHTFWLWIERLATRNVMTGYNCGGPAEPCIAPENRPYFRPGNDVTRGQSAKITANTFFPNCEIRR